MLEVKPSRGVKTERKVKASVDRKRIDYSKIEIPPLAQPVALQEEPEEFDGRTFIHPMADVSPLAHVGPGCRLWQQVQIRERAVIGSRCNIGVGVFIDRDVVIGECVKIQNYAVIPSGVMIEGGVFIGPHVTFTNERYPRAVEPNGRIKTEEDFECVLVGYGASIGAGAIILAGVRIGSFAMIGAGAVVTSNVPEHAMVVGNPARLTGYVCRCGKPLKESESNWFCQVCNQDFDF
jgi:acetyltransferase-like isoleucine patch superfamily enzyme